MALTHREREVYEIIKAIWFANGTPVSIRSILSVDHTTSVSNMQRITDRLQAKGLIHKNGGITPTCNSNCTAESIRQLQCASSEHIIIGQPTHVNLAQLSHELDKITADFHVDVINAFTDMRPNISTYKDMVRRLLMVAAALTVVCDIDMIEIINNIGDNDENVGYISS